MFGAQPGGLDDLKGKTFTIYTCDRIDFPGYEADYLEGLSTGKFDAEGSYTYESKVEGIGEIGAEAVKEMLKPEGLLDGDGARLRSMVYKINGKVVVVGYTSVDGNSALNALDISVED